MCDNSGTIPPDDPEDTGPVSDHTEAVGDLHPLSVEFLKAFGLHDIPAHNAEEAVARAAAWMYREGHIVVVQQNEPDDVALYLGSIANL